MKMGVYPSHTIIHTTDMKFKNRELNIIEYNRKETHLKSFPRFVQVELTRSCNLRCPMCRPLSTQNGKKNMCDDVFFKISKELFPYAEIVDLRGWGESFLISNLPQHINTADSYGCVVRILTNLNINRPDVYLALAKNSALVEVSIDTNDMKIYSKIRCGGSLQKVHNNLKELVLAYKQLKKPLDRISFRVTLQKQTLPGLENIVDLAYNNGLKNIKIGAVTTNNQKLSLEKETNSVDKALDSVCNRAEKLGVIVSLTTSLGLRKSIQKSICTHPWSMATISYDGTIGFCDHFLGSLHDDYSVGSIMEQAFVDIWNSDYWLNLRKSHLQNPSMVSVNPICDECYQFRNLDFEDFLYPALSEKRIFLTKNH